MYLVLPATPLHPIHLPATLAVLKDYHLYLSSAAASIFSTSLVEKTAMSVTKCQATGLFHATAGVHDSADVASRQLLANPHVMEAALLKVAGWCHHKQQGRMQPQQQQTNGPSGRRNKNSGGKKGKGDSSSSPSSSTTRSSRAAPAAAGFGARSSTSTSSSTSRRGEQESNMTGAAAIPGSYAQLECGIPNDHNLAAASLGSKAMWCYSRMASWHAASVGHVKGAAGLMGVGRDALVVLHATLYPALMLSSSSSSGNTSSSSSSSTAISAGSSSTSGSTTAISVCGSVSTAKLLLEALALTGAEVEGGMAKDEGVEALFQMLSFLQASLQLLPREELEAFISERGCLLLQVLSLVLDMIQHNQLLLQQPLGVPWAQLLQRVASLVLYVGRNEGGKAAA